MMGFSAVVFTTLSVALADDPTARPAFIAPIYGRQTAVTVPKNAPPLYVAVAVDDWLFGHDGFGRGEAGTTTIDWIEGLDIHAFLKSR